MAGKRGGARPGAGRKKGQVSQAKRAISEMAEKHGEAALQVLVDVAKEGESEGARVSAANAILDRAYGRPKQSMDMEHDLSDPFAQLLTELSGRSFRPRDE